MPTYEYQCMDCGLSFEAFQKMSENPLEKCVKCQGSVRKKVSGGSGLIFKGSGFYITDYNKKSSAKSTGSDKKSSSKTTSESGK